MNKYSREIRPNIHVDVYDVLEAFDVTCPAMAHAIKKCLMPGDRGAKSCEQDMREAIQSIERAIALSTTRATPPTSAPIPSPARVGEERAPWASNDVVPT